MPGEPPPARASTTPRSKLTIPLGALVGGKVVPGELSLAWNGHTGVLASSNRGVLEDEVEGSSDHDTAAVVALGARGEPTGAWRDALDAASLQVIAKKGTETEGEVFSMRAVALPGPTLVRAAQSYFGWAGQPCKGGAWMVGVAAPLTDVGVAECAVEPLLVGAGRGERQAVFAFGRDYVAYVDWMSRRNEGQDPPPPPPAAVLMVRSAAEPWRRMKVQHARARGALALGPEGLAIAARETAAKGKPSTVAVVLVPWAGGEDRRVEIDSGFLGEPTVAFVGHEAIVVYAKRDNERAPYTLRSATLSASGMVTPGPRLGPEGAVAPALIAAGNTLALAFTEEQKPSRVRFACGASTVVKLAEAAEIVSAEGERARDPELAMAPDGSGGVIAFHAFTAKTAGVRASAFSCLE